VSYDPQGPDLRPAGDYLVGTVACFYEEYGDFPRRMFTYALDHGLEFTGPAYTIYLLDAASVTEPEQFMLQIVAGVKRA
jgi:effector-binding domain-containing protein